MHEGLHTPPQVCCENPAESLSLEFEVLAELDILPGCIDTPMTRRETAQGAGKP